MALLPDTHLRTFAITLRGMVIPSKKALPPKLACVRSQSRALAESGWPKPACRRARTGRNACLPLIALSAKELQRQDPLHDVLDLGGVLGLESLVLFLLAVDLDRGAGGDVLGHLVFRIGLALVFLGGLLERRAVLFLVDRMALHAIALFQSGLGRVGIRRDAGDGGRHEPGGNGQCEEQLHFMSAEKTKHFFVLPGGLADHVASPPATPKGLQDRCRADP